MAFRLVAIVLAAGGSRRYGPENKLFLGIQGVSLVRRVVDTLVTSAIAEEVIVVTGFESDRVALTVAEARCVYNPRWEEGVGTSISTGAAACEADGYLFLLGDMPYVRVSTLQQLRAAWERQPNLPVVPGRISPPLIVPARFRSQMALLDGDQGCRSFLIDEAVASIEVDSAELRDIDTLSDL